MHEKPAIAPAEAQIPIGVRMGAELGEGEMRSPIKRRRLYRHNQLCMEVINTADIDRINAVRLGVVVPLGWRYVPEEQGNQNNR